MAEGGLLSVAPAVGDPMWPTRYRVVARRGENHDTVTLDLAPVDDPLPAPRPGQFHMLYVHGVGEVPISLSSIGPDRLGHTIRVVGEVTRRLAELAEGDTVGLRGPFGTAWDLTVEDGRDAVVVAGGLGLAPLRPVVHHLLAHRHRYGAVSVLIGARSPGELLFVDEVRSWAERDDVHVRVTVDHADADWSGPVGLVTALVDDAPLHPRAAWAQVCGPEVMMRFTIRALVARGVDPARIELSAERNMRCAVGLCGHCQLGPVLVCRDGAVFAAPVIEPLLGVRQL